MKKNQNIEDLTIKDIKIYKENAEYDFKNAIKDVFDKYKFINSVKIGTLSIKREDIANLYVKTLLNIEI